MTRDKVRKQTRAPDYTNLIAFALISADDMEIEELGSYSEAIESKDCEKWLIAMQE